MTVFIGMVRRIKEESYKIGKFQAVLHIVVDVILRFLSAFTHSSTGRVNCLKSEKIMLPYSL